MPRPVTSHATTFPEQPVDDDGSIYVPFAGRIPVAGKTLQAIDADIVERLAKKANQPQVMVQMRQNLSSNATVVGEVNQSTRVPLVPGNERLLDALAAAAGVRHPVEQDDHPDHSRRQCLFFAASIPSFAIRGRTCRCCRETW